MFLILGLPNIFKVNETIKMAQVFQFTELW